MPVVDARFDQTAKFDQGDFKTIRDLTKGKLEDLGYMAVLIDAWPTDVSGQKLAAMSDTDVCRLAPAESQVFLVITVNDVQDHYTGVTTSYSISGSFTAFDKSKAAKIYKDAGTGSHGGGGVIGSAAISTEKAWRAQIRFVNVLSSLPVNKK